METSPWRQRRSSCSKMEPANYNPNSPSRLIKGKAHAVLSRHGVKPEKSRKNLNEKLATIVLHSPSKRMSCKQSEEQKISLRDEQPEALRNEIAGIQTDISPSHALSEGFLHKLESLLNHHEKSVRSEIGDASFEMRRSFESTAAENLQLKHSLVAKEKLVGALQDRNSELESESEALMRRLDSTEKENVFLRYEYDVLAKDLEVSNEEIKYAQMSTELSHKQQLKSVNKIVELEAECQRLRLMIRKKFPSATMLLQPRVRSEAEERKMEMRRRNANLQNDFAMRDEFHSQKLHCEMMMEQLRTYREENKNLKEIILKKNAEIKDLSTVSGCGSRDEKSKNLQKQRVNGSCSEMSKFMEDYKEMEKLAIVTSEKNPGDGDDDHHDDDRSFDWLQAVLSAISRHQRISKREIKDILKDINIALGCFNASEDVEKAKRSMTKEEIKKRLSLLHTPKSVEENGREDLDLEEDNRISMKLKLEESEEKIQNLERKMKILEESRDMAKTLMETERSKSEDLDLQLSATRNKLSETEQKLSSMEAELGFWNSCYEELESTCLHLQLQLESVEMKERMKQSQNGRDVAAASIELGECREMAVNLHKQLKGLALPRKLNALSSYASNLTLSSSKRCSRRDQLIPEDDLKKPPSKNDVPHDDDDDDKCNAVIVYTPRVYSVTKGEEKKEGFSTMAIVKNSYEKQGLGFFKKLLFRKRSKKYLALTM